MVVGIESRTSKVSRVSEDFTVRRSISCLSWITRDCDVVLAANDGRIDLLSRELLRMLRAHGILRENEDRLKDRVTNREEVKVLSRLASS